MNEVKEFVNAMTEAGIQCSVTFIVVLKCIRVRFFTANGNEVSNPQPGTIIDTGIVSNVLPEFYLCCQHVNQGSATPTKYQTIFDSSNLTADDIQRYTYGLSHGYFNWSGTIRTPSVIKYASNLALFSGQYLEGKDVKPGLYKMLHYL
jgi:aubergine-like protein